MVLSVFHCRGSGMMASVVITPCLFPLCVESSSSEHPLINNAVVSAMEKHQVQWLIHGHTHRPAVHELIANQQTAFRVVLGAWHTEGSMVKVTADDVELIHFPF